VTTTVTLLAVEPGSGAASLVETFSSVADAATAAIRLRNADGDRTQPLHRHARQAHRRPARLRVLRIRARARAVDPGAAMVARTMRWYTGR